MKTELEDEMEEKEKKEIDEPVAIAAGQPIPVLQRPALKIDRQRAELYANLEAARSQIKSIG